MNCICATYSWEFTKCWKLDWRWVGFDFCLSESALLWTQCHSESSRSEDVSSEGEEDEDDSSSLSPSSPHSCSKVGQNAPPADSPAPCSFQIEGSNFLSATPAQWSVEEVCRFISSLQGWCWWMTWQPCCRPRPCLLFLDDVYPPVFLFRLWRAGCPVLVTGNRRTGSAASTRGTSHLHHEHQAGPCSQDLCLHQHPAWVMHQRKDRLPADESSRESVSRLSPLSKNRLLSLVSVTFFW